MLPCAACLHACAQGLWLHGNLLEDVPQSLAHLTRLTHLSLSGKVKQYHQYRTFTVAFVRCICGGYCILRCVEASRIQGTLVQSSDGTVSKHQCASVHVATRARQDSHAPRQGAAPDLAQPQALSTSNSPKSPRPVHCLARLHTPGFLSTRAHIDSPCCKHQSACTLLVTTTGNTLTQLPDIFGGMSQLVDFAAAGNQLTQVIDIGDVDPLLTCHACCTAWKLGRANDMGGGRVCVSAGVRHMPPGIWNSCPAAQPTLAVHACCCAR